jgi:signal transduction histidine kinase
MVGPEPSKFDSTVRKMCEEAASRNNIDVAVNIEITNEGLSPLVSSVAFQVLRELVNNAVMHSGGSKIDVNIDILEDSLQVQVHDNGAGFAVESTRARKATTGHLGLVGVEERVRAIKGRFELSSEPGDGTTATVKLPM